MGMVLQLLGRVSFNWYQLHLGLSVWVVRPGEISCFDFYESIIICKWGKQQRRTIYLFIIDITSQDQEKTVLIVEALNNNL